MPAHASAKWTHIFGISVSLNMKLLQQQSHLRVLSGSCSAPRKNPIRTSLLRMQSPKPHSNPPNSTHRSAMPPRRKPQRPSQIHPLTSHGHTTQTPKPTKPKLTRPTNRNQIPNTHHHSHAVRPIPHYQHATTLHI
jgi:hypothetical protein